MLARSQVRYVIRKCTRCTRFNPALTKYKIPDLPLERILEALPFHTTGINYFGPTFINKKQLRIQNKIKAYDSLFVCMTTKVVHIEAVSDLTEDAFLAAFKRFIGQRGLLANIYVNYMH